MKTITIVGVGALGSHTVQFLRNADALIRVIDFDRIETRNVQAQFHGAPSVGKGKAQSLQQMMLHLYKRRIEALPHKLVENNVKELLGGSSLVIDCLDNGASRRIVQKYVRETSTPCLHGALSADGTFGSVLWDEVFVVDDETPGQRTCEDGAHLPFIATVSTYIAQVAQTFWRTGAKQGFQVYLGGVSRI